MTKRWRQIFFWGLCVPACVYVVSLGTAAIARERSTRGLGIIPHPSGQAVYIVGDGCTVNAGHMDLLPWCAEAERDWNAAHPAGTR